MGLQTKIEIEHGLVIVFLFASVIGVVTFTAFVGRLLWLSF